MTNPEMKKDITRLKKLLRNYRDHIITKLSEERPKMDIIICIDKVDEAISMIKNHL